MGKIVARVAGALLFLVPAISFALGLGPITMRSSLNQPLDAEIDIHSAQPGDLDGLAIRLASPEDFARVNVERSIFLTQIQFKLNFRSDGSAYIKLTTRQPVTEPYLDFLIEARWPRGRALKEYTVLVDPPVLTAETPKPVEQAGTSPVFSEPQRQQRRPTRQPRQPIRQAEPESEQVSPPPLRREPPPVEREFEPEPEVASRDEEREQFTPSGDVDYGKVRKGDTLWEIARNTRPDNSISIQQMMLAYLRDNPDAFIDGNINKLKAGYVLRIEDSSSISRTSQREAVSEERRQNLAWRESRSTRTVRQSEETSQVAGGEAGLPDFEARDESSASTSTAATEEPRLELVAPGTEDKGSGGAGAEEGGAKKEDLARASEALDAGRKESEELTSRSAELDEQLQSMQRLIQLKDEELLALQNQVAQGTVDQAIDEQKQIAAQQQQNKPKQQKPKQPDMVEELLSDPVLLGLAGLLVVAVLGWLVMRRRRMHDGFEESILNVGAHADASGPMSAQPESAMVSDFVMSDMTGGGTDVSEVDAISEADVYLAYGRHQQAEDILRQAMEQSPDRLDLQAKLLEVFHAAKNADAFESEAQALHARIGGDETNTYWTDIVSLGRELCPNSPLFGGAGGAGDMGGGMSDDEADLLDFDFDANAATGGSAGDSADDALDFDMSSLDFDMDTGEESRTNDSMSNIDALDTAMGSEEDSSGAIDFDMSLGDDTGGADTVLHEAPAHDDSPIDLDMGSSAMDFGSSDDSLDMGLDFESSSSSDDDAIELSFDESDSSIGVASSMGDDDDMSLDFDQGADIVQLDTGGGDDIDLDGELDEDIFNNVDEVGTKLDLAKAYVDMGDSDGARSILDEVLEEGDDTQKQQAEELLQQMG